jgi:predicted PurR-regulated permease PerM
MSGFFSSLTPSINSLTNTLISFLVFIFFLFYFFRDGEEILDSIIDKIPLQKMQKEKFLEEFKNVTNAGVYGLILVGLLEGILGAVGFYLFKVPSPIFWGLLIMILSMLPVVGTSLAWIPVALTKFAAHDYFNGIAILLFGIIILSGIETFAHPRIIGKKANIHPLAIVLGVFGGIGFLGITGIIFGPLIFVMLGAIVNLILQGEK